MMIIYALQFGFKKSYDTDYILKQTIEYFIKLISSCTFVVAYMSVNNFIAPIKGVTKIIIDRCVPMHLQITRIKYFLQC